MYRVEKKSELSLLGAAFKEAGFRTYRVRTECSCQSRKGADNRRDGLLVVDGDRIILKVVRCKACAKQQK